MKIFTIGFTKTTAENFFSRLEKSGVERLIDIRLNNVSQLAGFAKKDDLKYFAKKICDIDYIHMPKLAPSKAILDEYKKNKGKWSEFEHNFINLIQERRIDTLDKELFNNGCLLCSEDKPRHCHRRLVAEYLKDHWDNVEIVHL